MSMEIPKLNPCFTCGSEEVSCKESYDFIEPPLIFPDNEIEQIRPNGVYFDWVGLCKNNTLTFGRESGDSCKIVLSFQIYPEDGVEKFHTQPNLEEYWNCAKKYLIMLRELSPPLYYRILDLLTKHNHSIREELK